MRMDFKISFYLYIVLVLSSCSGHRINHYLHTIDMNVGDSVIVDISSIIKHPFDYYYYSGGIAYPSNVSDLIGVEYHGRSIDDDCWALFFIKDKKLVYEERFSTRYLDDIREIEWAEATSCSKVMFIKRPNGSFWWCGVDSGNVELNE